MSEWMDVPENKLPKTGETVALMVIIDDQNFDECHSTIIAANWNNDKGCWTAVSPSGRIERIDESLILSWTTIPVFMYTL